MTLDDFNSTDSKLAQSLLLTCCGSEAWATEMSERRPFADHAGLHIEAQRIWWSLAESDWLEAFSKHPQIGDSSSSAWSAQEQRGMDRASAKRAAAMRELNREYASKFGFIFIICATGKSAQEMHRQLVERLENNPAEELRIAAAAQGEIMKLRLDKLFAP